MKLLTKHTDYAIRALITLAENKQRYVSSREISVRQDIPYQFLRRILHELIRAKLVVSQEGGSGGFKINVNPDDISAADVISIFQGRLQLSDCLVRKHICSKRSGCVLRSEMMRIEKIMAREFHRIVLTKLLKNKR